MQYSVFFFWQSVRQLWPKCRKIRLIAISCTCNNQRGPLIMNCCVHILVFVTLNATVSYIYRLFTYADIKRSRYVILRTSTVFVWLISAMINRVTEEGIRHTVSIVARELKRWTGRPRSCAHYHTFTMHFVWTGSSSIFYNDGSDRLVIFRTEFEKWVNHQQFICFMLLLWCFTIDRCQYGQVSLCYQELKQDFSHFNSTSWTTHITTCPSSLPLYCTWLLLLLLLLLNIIYKELLLDLMLLQQLFCHLFRRLFNHTISAWTH